MPRFAKQLFFGSLFLAVVLGVSFWIWQTTRPQPNCLDGIQNQNEQGVDCGGVCALACSKEPAFKTISVVQTKFFETEPGIYDVLGEVVNKNTDFGSPSFGYEFSLLSATGAVVGSHRGTAYALPREKRIIAEQHIEAGPHVSDVRLTVFSEQWIEVANFPQLTLSIRDRLLEPILAQTASTGLKASGVLVNRTGLDLAQADVIVTLKDAQGALLGVGVTDVRTFRDGEQRAFEIRWPHVTSQQVDRADFEAYTNVLANENFLSRYGVKGQEPFRQEVPIPSVNLRWR